MGIHMFEGVVLHNWGSPAFTRNGLETTPRPWALPRAQKDVYACSELYKAAARQKGLHVL